MIEQSWLSLAAGLLVIVFLVFLVFLVKKKLGIKAIDQSLSHKEKMFTSVLEKAVGGQYTIYCKVPMLDVFEVTVVTSERAKRKALKPLLGRQFDYLVCDVSGKRVICAVELDDHHYENQKHQKSDLLIEDICLDAKLPLLRVAPQNGYNLVEIIERFERTISLTELDENIDISSRFNLKVVDPFVEESLQAA